MKPFAKWIFFLVFLAAGCVSARAPRYYFLSTPPIAPQAGAQQFPVTILVGRLNAPRVLRDDRVVYDRTRRLSLARTS